MRRHDALAPLSRDHHRALVAARELKRATPDTAAAARERFLAYWRPDGGAHFAEEEQILLPFCAAFIEPDHPQIAQVLTDHVRIRYLARQLAEASHPPPMLLQELGRRLEQHVRLEERELFPLIERSLPEEELERLIELLGH